MPTYKIRNKETEETFEEFMTYSELQEKLKNDPNLVHVLSTPSFITQAGSTLSKTSSGWRDLLGNISKGAPRNKINK